MPVPHFYTILQTARAWNVPPWVVSCEDGNDPVTVALWERRQRLVRSMEM